MALMAYRLKAVLVGAVWLLLGAFFLCAAPGYAVTSHVADPWRIDDLAVLVDTRGQETIASVSQAGRASEFVPAPHGFSAGYTRSVHWLRFTLQAPPPDAQGRREILLEIHPPYVDDLQIYLSQPQLSGVFDFRKGGDLQPHAAKEYAYRAFVYRVTFADTRPRTAYVRLQTSSSSLLAVKAWEPSQFVAQTTHEYALLGVLFGLMLAGLLVNLWHGLWRTQAIHRRYIVYLGFTILMLLGINGLVGEFLLPHLPYWAHQWVSVSFLLVVISGTRFYEMALDIEHAARWMRWLYRGQFWLVMACLPAPLLDLYPEVVRLLLPLLLFTLFVGSVRSIQNWRQHSSNGKGLLLAHLLSLVGSLSAAPTLLGLLPGQVWLIYSFQIGSVCTLLALQLMLGQHVRAMQAGLQRASIDVEVANATAQQERAEREQQRHFLSMLTHELKTPLSVIRMRLGTATPTPRMQTHAVQAVQDIDDIVERCALVSQLDEVASAIHRAPCSPGEMLSEILAQQGATGRVLLKLDAPALVQPLHTDPLLLRTVLNNLIDNALKYAPPDATICVGAALHTQAGCDGVRIRIQNPVGPAGRPDPVRAFDKYYRAPGAYQQSGSGLGLYIAKALSERLGGTLDYRPETDQITFDLWIPL